MVIIYKANSKQEQQQIDLRLESATSAFQNQYQQRSYYLQAFAETAAKDFGLKEVFDADARSFLIALNNHRKRIDADLAFAVNRKNLIIGQLFRTSAESKVKLGPEQNNQFRFPQWFDAEKATSQLYLLEGQVYQLSFAPLKSGQQVVGWIGYGYQVNGSLAQNLANVTGLNVEFLLSKAGDRWLNLAAASPYTTGSPANPMGQLIVSGNPDPTTFHTSISLGEVDQQDLKAAIYGSRSSLLETLRQNLWQLMVVEGVTILLALVIAYNLSGTISKPVKELVRQAQYIARGNYDSSVNITGKNELGQLAQEFNLMQQAVLVREQKINHQLRYNSLTNLPNRYSLLETLEELCASGSPGCTLLHLDIRRTKTVNDTLGYDTGNLMIKEVGKRLSELNKEKMIFHLGADEFAVILMTTDQMQVVTWCNNVEKFLDPPLCGDGVMLHLQVHAGFAKAPMDAGNAQLLLQKADTALSHSKREMKAFLPYKAEMDADAGRTLSLVNDLRIAIESDQLQLFYQPKLDINAGVVRDLEALIRWRHPEQGMIPPDAFIGIAEQTGQIDALTRWVIREAARQYNAWVEEELLLSIAVNISAENLKNQNFTAELEEIWQEFSLPMDALTLEITESAVVSDPVSAIGMLCDIQDQGIKLSIDDYGTGYSSLAQLKQLPVNELKIDRSFVDKVYSDPDDQIIVRSTIRMAHDMGLSVVAEGIEDAETLEWLGEQGCDKAQGYFISRPAPAAEIGQWLKEKDKAISANA
ncbi:EAL domain-containing protein [Oceanospirillum sediminis]|uniref:cyclic-guanylate-specific phosphodiesterase n=1 Tax=Oceanospirillum sediminis TaxID=2760088 RepID=A0A839IT12_9GAMM|nr:bifunctional diguanylate cyclase/phosphodiesterase [Oceanospirillum sediminis]MBB1487567.1 EAL domain-containing protein [Oceanospirillum sediminis]